MQLHVTEMKMISGLEAYGRGPSQSRLIVSAAGMQPQKKACQGSASASYIYVHIYIYMAGEEDKHISQPQRVSSYYTVNGKWATAKGILIIRRLFGSAFKCYTPKGRATVHQPW